MSTTATPTRTIYNPVQQDSATFVETVEESGGARTVLDIEVAPGGGNRPHRHLTYAERFTVQEGTLTVLVGDRTVRLEAGESATAPAHTMHCFSNETDAPVRFRVELEPGHRGMELALQIGYGLARDGKTGRDSVPRNLLHLALLAEWSDIRGMGMMRVIAPVLGVLAGIARRRGVDALLIERYVEV